MGLFNFIKSPGQIRTESKTRKTKKKIRGVQAQNRALKGGGVAGLSSRAASNLASNPAAFSGGGTSGGSKRYR